MDLPSGNQRQVLVHETDCIFQGSDGREYSGEGAYVDPRIAVVYIKVVDTISRRISVHDWHGSELGLGFITSIWKQSNYRERYTMASAVFQIEGIWYKGRFSPDHGDLCRGTRIRQEKVIAKLTARLQSHKSASTSR